MSGHHRSPWQLKLTKGLKFPNQISDIILCKDHRSITVITVVSPPNLNGNFNAFQKTQSLQAKFCVVSTFFLLKCTKKSILIQQVNPGKRNGIVRENLDLYPVLLFSFVSFSSHSLGISLACNIK